MTVSLWKILGKGYRGDVDGVDVDVSGLGGLSEERKRWGGGGEGGKLVVVKRFERAGLMKVVFLVFGWPFTDIFVNYSIENARSASNASFRIAERNKK